MPVIIIVMTITGSLWQALHPGRDAVVVQIAQNFVFVFGIALATALGIAMSKAIKETAARQQLEVEMAERRRTEQRMEAALRGADLGTWDWNLQTGEIIFNERFATMLGYELGDLKPEVRSWEDTVHPADWPGVQETLDAHLKIPTNNYATEHRLRHKSGEWIWVLDTGKVIERDTDSAPLRMCGTHLDITARTQNEIALQQYANIVSNTTDMLALLDKNFVYLSVNTVYASAFDKTPEELIGRAPADLMGEDFFSTLVKPHVARLAEHFSHLVL